MLKEIKNARQNKGDPFRRVSNSDSVSLICWYEKDALLAFQICYEEENETLLFNWDKDKGYSNKVVDLGESRSFRHKMSAIPIEKRESNIGTLISKFNSEAKEKNLPDYQFILDKINRYN